MAKQILDRIKKTEQGITDLYGKVRTLSTETPSTGGGLAGTNYVYVSANGTPEENAIELQAAYDLAKVKVDYQESIQPVNVGRFYYGSGYLYISDYSLYAQNGGPIQDNVMYQLLFDGIPYFATCLYGGMMWDFVMPAPPSGSYTTLEILVNTITYNLVTVVVAPGKYSFASDFFVDTQYVNIVSLTGNRDILFTGTGTIQVNSNDIYLKGIDVLDKQFIVFPILENTTFENCAGGWYSFSRKDANYFQGSIINGTYINCQAIGGFGYFSTTIGIYIDCISIEGQSFGCYGDAAGVFINCKCIIGQGFGLGGIASGIFENCQSGVESFGGYNNATGTFTNCVGDYGSFGGQSSYINGGKLYFCRLKSGTFLPVVNGARTYYCIDGNGDTNNQ